MTDAEASEPSADRTPSRLRLVAFVLLALTAGGLFLAWSQPWFTFGLETGPLVVRGDVAGGALPPLALVSLAMILALALSGPVFRTILGVLEVFVGIGAVTASAFALAQPEVVSSPALTKALGVSGRGSGFLWSTIDATAWPVIGIVAGVLGVLAGLYIVITARSWPVSGRRFNRIRTEPEGSEAEAEADPIREWDALSEGDDPTRPTP